MPAPDLEPRFLEAGSEVEPYGGRYGPGDALFALRKANGADPSSSGRTELKCLFCDKLDPMEMTAANKWADSPLATPISETVPRDALLARTFRGEDVAFGFLMSVLTRLVDRLSLGHNGQSLLRSEPLVGGNRLIGEKERSPLAVPDHGLNGIEEVFAVLSGFPSSPVASR